MVDAIGNIPLPVAPAPALSSVTAANVDPISPPAPAPVQPAVSDQVDISPQAQQLGKPKVQYANPEVLGTQAVTMYMVDGQLYTRYRDERTNKVTYIPNEAQVLSGNSSGNAQPSLNITA